MLKPSPDRPSQSDHRTRALPISVIDDLAGSSAPFADGSDAVIWQRDVPTQVTAWLNALSVDAMPQDRVILKSSDVSACLIEQFENKGIALNPALAWLSQDVACLAKWVEETVNSSFLRMRMEVVTDDACSKFHIDNVVARLICTYRGPGTQLNIASAPDEACLSLPTGDPVLLKGKRWPQSSDSPLRHRSPAIAGTGLTRWLVVLEGCDRAEWMPEYDRTYRDLNLPESN